MLWSAQGRHARDVSNWKEEIWDRHPKGSSDAPKDARRTYCHAVILDPH